MRRRTFSNANPALAHDLRAQREKVMTTDDGNACASFPATVTGNTFGLHGGEERVRNAVLDIVLDKAIKSSLEDRKIINWWLDPRLNLAQQLPPLHPVDTDADGDCLLHSLSLALVGVHDRDLTLRKALHSSLKGISGQVFRGRWQQALAERNRAEGFELDEGQWESEWQNLVVRSGEKGRSLEDLHVLTMAHVLSRPIIVYSHRVLEGVEGDAISTNQMGGLYLPLELDASECGKEPLLLAYWNGHFVPLLTDAKGRNASGDRKISQRQYERIPIEWQDGATFALCFHVPARDGTVHECIGKYLRTSHVLLPDERRCLCAEREVVTADDGLLAWCQKLVNEFGGISPGGHPSPAAKASPSANPLISKQHVQATDQIPYLQIESPSTRSEAWQRARWRDEGQRVDGSDGVPRKRAVGDHTSVKGGVGLEGLTPGEEERRTRAEIERCVRHAR